MIAGQAPAIKQREQGYEIFCWQYMVASWGGFFFGGTRDERGR
jgi:hypothetical protein